MLPDRRDHPRRRRRRQEDPQVAPPATSSSTSSWATRARSASSPRRRSSWSKRPEAEFSAFCAFPDYLDAWQATGELARSGVATLAGVVLFDEWKLEYLRRDDEAYIPQPDWVKAVVAVAALRQRATRCASAPSGSCASRKESRRRVPRRRDLPGRLGVAPRPLRHAAARPHAERPGRADELALRGRRDPLLEAAGGAREVARDRRPASASASTSSTTGGCSRTPTGAQAVGRLPHRDRHRHLGAWSWDDESWAAWVDAKREIARVAIESGGSISACHGSCREGEVDLVPLELGGGFEVMKQIKRTLDPQQRHEPRQVPARQCLRRPTRRINDARLSTRSPEAAGRDSASPTRSSCASSTSTRSTRSS